MVTANTYGQFSAQALQPYPIESTLAQLGYGDSPTAAKILGDQFWLERQAHENLYGQELAQQHQFAYDQLRQQLAETAMKEVPNMGKVAGATEVLAPTLMGLGIGNSDSLTNLARNSQAAADATNLEHAAAGVNSLSQGGFDPTAVATQYGLNVGNYQGPALLQAAKVRAAATLGAAAMNANQANLPTYTRVLSADPAAGTNQSISVKLNPRLPFEPQIQNYEQLGANLRAIPPPAPSNQPAAIPPVPRRVPATQTNLQGAPATTGATAIQGLPQGSTLLTTASKEGSTMQNAATQAVNGLRGSPLHDVVAPQGTVHTIYKDPQGSYWLVGRDNKAYPLQPPARTG